MNGYVIAGFLIACIAIGLWAYRQGYDNGQTAAVAATATQTNTAQTQVMDTTKAQLAAAKAEAVKLRGTAAKLEVEHERTSQALSAALAKLAVHDGCVAAHVPAELVRELTAARDHAAQRAATGTADAAVPAPAGAASPTPNLR